MSAAVIQKSIREGFALTVTEALWKGVPVVGGAVGGIRLQLGGGVGGFLVGSVAECAEKLDYLLSNDKERATLGKSGKEHVRRNFLIPRLLRDELEIAAQARRPERVPHQRRRANCRPRSQAAAALVPGEQRQGAALGEDALQRRV